MDKKPKFAQRLRCHPCLHAGVLLSSWLAVPWGVSSALAATGGDTGRQPYLSNTITSVESQSSAAVTLNRTSGVLAGAHRGEVALAAVGGQFGRLPASQVAPPSPPLSSIRWDASKQGPFVMSAIQDKQGQLWVGCEDTGVWRYNPSAPESQQWTQFTTRDGLGDNNTYAISCDKLGRIWVGHLNHGVSVFNGKTWRNYSVMDGPLGSRVFCIATCPTDGDIWIGTEAGLSRYSLQKNSWSYYTRAEGLPSDQANAIAFDKAGSIFVGTQCDGIAIAAATDDYKVWRTVTGPKQMPNTPGGKGCPTNLINCLLVSPITGTVYAGTTTGLARSEDDGKTWHFLRGADWEAKVKGLYQGPSPIKTDTRGHILLEDYVTTLAEDRDGWLYIGHRQLGMEVVDSVSGTTVYPSSTQTPTNLYVRAILPMAGQHPLVACYGEGIQQVTNAPIHPGRQLLLSSTTQSEGFPALPVPASAPTNTELNAMLRRVEAVPQQRSKDVPIVVALDDDWLTQGTWIDRYGRFAAILCNMNGGGNDMIRGYQKAWVARRGWIGRSGGDGDYLRYYVTEHHTDDGRSLQNMLYAGRTQAEWDDHGEQKPMSLAGPSVYGTIKAPKGQYILSCYLFNKDGHEGNNRLRDYLLQVKPTPMTDEKFNALGATGGEAEALFEQSAPEAHARVKDFWGGVWKRFYVNLPADGQNYLTVRVGRNYSFNTILCGLFLDPVGELCGPQGPIAQPANPHALHLSARSKDDLSDTATTSLYLLDRLLTVRGSNSVWYEKNSRVYLLSALRSLLQKGASGKSRVEMIEKRGLYQGLRSDVAACLNDIQLFQKRNLVYFSPDYYDTWAWESLTRSAQANLWDPSKYLRLGHWDDAPFAAFVTAQQAHQSW